MIENTALTESTFYILLALSSPQHGYGIMQSVEQMSNGRVKLAAGTLYGALTNLCDKKWITLLPVEAGSRKKEYQLTEKGYEILINEVARLKELVANADHILGENNNG